MAQTQGPAADTTRPAADTARPAAGGIAVHAPIPTRRTAAGSIRLRPAGASLLSIDGAELDYLPVGSAADLPRLFGGSFAAGTGVGGFEQRYILHGLRHGSVTLFVDGLPLVDAAVGSSPLGIYPRDLAARIEYLTGPLAAAAGFGTPGAALHVATADDPAPRPRSRIRYVQSSHATSVLDGSITQDVAAGLSLHLGLQHPVTDGRFANSAHDAWMGRIRIGARFPGVSIHAYDLFTRRARGLFDGVSPTTPESLRFEPFRAGVVNPLATEFLVRHDAGAGVSLGADTAALTALSFRFGAAHREYRDDGAASGSGGSPVRDTRREQTFGVSIRHDRALPVGGLTVSAEAVDRRLLEDSNIRADRSLQTGLAGAFSWEAGRPFTFAAAVRFDRALGRGRLSPALEAGWRASPGVRLVAGASRSHRFPSFAELHGVKDLASPLASPDPERHDLIEARILGGDTAGTRIRVSAFRRSVAGTIALDSASAAGAAPLFYRRGGTISRSGASAAGTLAAGPVEIEAALEYLAYGGSSGRRIAPAWHADLGIYLRGRFAGGNLHLRAGVRGRYFTRYDGESYAQRYDLHLPSGATVPPAGVLDLLVYAGIGDAVIRLEWENLLDRDYLTTIFYPMDERTLRFGVTWRFVD